MAAGGAHRKRGRDDISGSAEVVLFIQPLTPALQIVSPTFRVKPPASINLT